MRVVIDVLGAPERSGGMRLHATEVVRTWAEEFPADRLVVLGPAWTRTEFADLPQVEVDQWRNEQVVWRSTGQVLRSAWLARRLRPDALISLSPLVSPLVGSVPTFCFQHDWRHRKNPTEFPLHQRLYRQLWELSARRATANLCISGKAMRETREAVPAASVELVENGRDHPRRWSLPQGGTRQRTLVTFGHHNNKRPELVVEALAKLARDPDADDLRLVVLGARGDYAQTLSRLATQNGVADRVELPGFVEDDAYQSIIAEAACLVLASSDEGFGLPIAEAQFFGVPSVITADSGMQEIFGDLPVAAEPDPGSLADAIRVALSRPPSELAVRDDQTWAAAVRRIRELVAAQPETSRRLSRR